MPPIEDLRSTWTQQVRTASFHASLSFTEEGIVLGAGTVLAEDEAELGRKGERILALLSTAYRRPVLPAVLDNLRHAAREAARGKSRARDNHLAHTGLPPLVEDEDARRLFIADRLLASGIAPRTLLEAQAIDTGPLDLLAEQRFD